MDIVYTYVNNNDKIWQDKYNINKLHYFNESINNIDSNTTNRFSDNNELLYSLRSVEKYINFYKNIYIVTDNQIPNFLNLNNNPKIKIIDHKQIIPKEYLPTFNSHVIELYLHNIPNLSSPFMYLNDDIIFTKPLSINDFIYNYKTFYVFLDPINYTKKGIPIINEYGFRSAWKNSNKWLDENFKIEDRLKMQHAPMIIYKDIIYELFNLLHSKIIETSKNKFRSINDINLLCSIYIYYSLYKNKAINNESLSLECKSIFNDVINNNNKLNNIFQQITNNEISILCVNEFNSHVNNFLINAFPNKSSFEI